MYFHTLPQELLSIISSYLPYEDIINFSDILDVEISILIRYNTKIISNQNPSFLRAPKINLGHLNPGITFISNSILIEIKEPEDFETLGKLKGLNQANFLLPHNKYESITMFERYLNTFFDIILKRESDVLLKKLTFRLLYSSDYNEQLGIIMCKGMIELINAKNFIGFNSDNRIIHDLDFLINIIKNKLEQYRRNVNLFYSLMYEDAPYIYENDLFDDYVKNNILPVANKPDQFSLKKELQNIDRMIRDMVGDSYIPEKWLNYLKKDFLMIHINIGKDNDEDGNDVKILLNKIRALLPDINISDEDLKIEIIRISHNEKTKILSPNIDKNKINYLSNELLNKYYYIYQQDNKLKEKIWEDWLIMKVLPWDVFNLFNHYDDHDYPLIEYMYSDVYNLKKSKK